MNDISQEQAEYIVDALRKYVEKCRELVEAIKEQAFQIGYEVGQLVRALSDLICKKQIIILKFAKYKPVYSMGKPQRGYPQAIKRIARSDC